MKKINILKALTEARTRKLCKYIFYPTEKLNDPSLVDSGKVKVKYLSSLGGYFFYIPYIIDIDTWNAENDINLPAHKEDIKDAYGLLSDKSFEKELEAGRLDLIGKKGEVVLISSKEDTKFNRDLVIDIING